MDPLRPLLLDRSAVSNVIGVALLVAITVSLVTVLGVGFVGFGEERQTRAPRVVAETRADPGADGSFSDAGDGGVCAGGTYDDDDTITIEFLSGESLPKDRVRFLVGDREASMAPCAGGSAELDYLATVPDEITAGAEIDIAESNGGAAIRSGATVRVVWTSPDGERSYTVHKHRIGA